MDGGEKNWIVKWIRNPDKSFLSSALLMHTLHHCSLMTWCPDSSPGGKSGWRRNISGAMRRENKVLKRLGQTNMLKWKPQLIPGLDPVIRNYKLRCQSLQTIWIFLIWTYLKHTYFGNSGKISLEWYWWKITQILNLCMNLVINKEFISVILISKT